MTSKRTEGKSTTLQRKDWKKVYEQINKVPLMLFKRK